VDISQWQSFGSGVWSAEGSEIVGRFQKNKPGAGYLLTRDTFTDFRLTTFFNISSGGLSGVLVREPRRRWGTEGDNRPSYGPDGGYEILIAYQNRENPTGTIRGIQKPKKIAGSEGKWNELEIVCRGAEIRISIGGQNVNRFNQLRVQPGVIGFAVLGAASQDNVVRFRNIVISSVA